MIDGETNNQPQQYEQLSLEMRSVVTPQSYCAGSQLSRRSPALRTGTLQEQQEENDNENVSWKLQQTLEEKRALEVELEQIRARLSSVRIFYFLLSLFYSERRQIKIKNRNLG